MKYLPISNAHKSGTNPKYARCIISNDTESGKIIVRRFVNEEMVLTPESMACLGSLKFAYLSWIYSSAIRRERL